MTPSAKRARAKGHAYPGDDPVMKKFDEAFPYQETPGQQKAIEDIKHDMSGLMLRFAFMEKYLRKDEVHNFLDALRDALSNYVENLRAHLDGHASKMPLHGRLALESGLEQYRSHLHWVGQAKGHIT